MTPNIETAFFHDLSIAAVHSLRDFYSVVESELYSRQEREKNKAEGEIRRLNINEEDRYVEWSLAIDKNDDEYKMLYSNYFSYSFATLTFIILEDWLYRLCKAAKDMRKLSEPIPSKTRSIIKEYKRYLKEANITINEKYWHNIMDFNGVRNCIVHASGNMDRLSVKDKQHIKNMIKRKIGILGEDDLDYSEHIPLYREPRMIVIEKRYLLSIIKDIETLFEKFCDIVPLERIDFKSWFDKQ